MFIKNAWYVAAHSEELLPGGVLGRTIADEPLVICRQSNGKVFALEDLCPHRLAPLSFGELVNDNLRCGYHGATFDSTGRCVCGPGQETPSGGVAARAFTIQEKYGFVWVWPGDPALSGDERTLPSFLEEYGCPPNEYRSGRITLAADYRLLIDNLLDPAHAEFVHRSSFGAADWQFDAANWQGEDSSKRPSAHFSSDVRDDGIDFTFDLRNSRGNSCFSKAYAMKVGQDVYDKPIDLRMDVEWAPPGIFSYAKLIKAAGSNEEPLRLVNLHLVTPETEFSTHYFYRCSCYWTGGNGDIRDFWFKTAEKAFHEDKFILEGQQRRVGRADVMTRPVKSFATDHLALKGREMLDSLAAKEAAFKSETASPLVVAGAR